METIYYKDYGGKNCPFYYNPVTKILHVSLYLAGPIENGTKLTKLISDIPAPTKTLTIPFVVKYSDGDIGLADYFLYANREVALYFDTNKTAAFICLHGDVVIE